MPETIYIIDGTALVYRSYFAFIRNPLINSKGEDTSAAYGFASTMLRLIKDRNPDYIVITFDSKEPTFRHKMYAEYKATREKMPDELVGQLSRIDDVVEAFGISAIAIPGFEADDIMGTLAKKSYEAGLTVYLVTGDKDLMQLVNDRVYWLNMRKSSQDIEILDPKGVEKKFGVPPRKMIQAMSLMGDSSDNIPGVRGIGPKTAVKLIKEYGTLENVLENIENIKQKSLKEKLDTYRDSAFLSRDLVTIDCGVDIKFDPENYKLPDTENEKVIELFKELEFSSLIENLPQPEAVDDIKRDYHTVIKKSDLLNLVENLKKNRFVFDLETTSLNFLDAEIVGLSFSWEEGRAYYVPLTALDFRPEIEPNEILALLKPVFEDPGMHKAGQNVKYDASILRQNGIGVRGVVFDTMIAAYLLEPDKRRFNLDALSFDYLNIKKIPTAALIGKGKNQVTMDRVPLDTTAEYANEDADCTFRLWKLFEPKLTEKKLEKLFNEIELPLIDVLMDMEFAGVSLDTGFLKEMSAGLHKTMDVLKKEIFQLSGEEFNINSPQQLGKILFEKLEIQKQFGVKRVKKTTLGFSTDISVLEKFQGHPVVSRVLDYRQNAKLQSTYVDALPRLIHPRTNRLHTSFNQAVAATGRLSSSDPNLQNIPIRRAQGREIRKAFIPADDSKVILSADYSQIELRIMAHLADDPGMREAFVNGEDIHAKTASKIFGFDLNFVTQEMRYRAKAINFGIIYGMGSFRLARETGISNQEAQDFINAYFAAYPGVNTFIASQIAAAFEKGYVTTMNGRRRYLPDIRSDKERVRKAAENIAVNTPIQGTAAELIKIAMIRLNDRLTKGDFHSKMILQIHDELVLETRKDELEEVTALVKECMENTVKLSVPLQVDIKSGANWFEAH